MGTLMVVYSVTGMSPPRWVPFGSPEGAPCNSEVPAAAVSSKRRADAQKAGTVYAYGRIHAVALRCTSHSGQEPPGWEAWKMNCVQGVGGRKRRANGRCKQGTNSHFLSSSGSSAPHAKNAARWL